MELTIDDIIEIVEPGLITEMREDFIHLALIAGIVVDAANFDEFDVSPAANAKIMNLTMKVITHLLQRGDVKVGSMNEGWTRPIEWPLNAEAAAERIERDWKLLGRQLRIGEVAWFKVDDDRKQRNQ